MGRLQKKSGPRVLVVDDHALFVEGLRLLLTERVSGCALRWAATCEQALDSLRDDPGVDIVLFDPGLPGVAHGRAFELLQCAVPAVPIVCLSGDDRRRAMNDALRGGARGYIPKGASAEILVQAVMLVLAGGTYIPKELAPADPQETESQLTPRERQILRMVAGGLSNKEIAADLGLSESTVRVHVAAIGRGLGGLSRFELATSQVALALLRRNV